MPWHHISSLTCLFHVTRSLRCVRSSSRNPQVVSYKSHSHTAPPIPISKKPRCTTSDTHPGCLSYFFPSLTHSWPTPTTKTEGPYLHSVRKSFVTIPAPCLYCTSLLLLPQQQDYLPQLLPRKHWEPLITIVLPASFTHVSALSNIFQQPPPNIKTVKKMPHTNKWRLEIYIKTHYGLGERFFQLIQLWTNSHVLVQLVTVSNLFWVFYC